VCAWRVREEWCAKHRQGTKAPSGLTASCMLCCSNTVNFLYETSNADEDLTDRIFVRSQTSTFHYRSSSVASDAIYRCSILSLSPDSPVAYNFTQYSTHHQRCSQSNHNRILLLIPVNQPGSISRNIIPPSSTSSINLPCQSHTYKFLS
jgi:hypothetical protein